MKQEMFRIRFPTVALLVAVTAALLLVAPARAEAASLPADRWALIVGVDRFLGSTRPNFGAAADAADMRAALIRNGFPADHIRVLTDGGARADDIRAGLRWLVDHSGPQTFSVFAYSGHVKQVRTTEYLWPHDNRLIPDTELAATLRQLRGTAWINIAGCEAAGFNEDLAGPTRLFTASSQAHEKSYEIPSAKASVFSMFAIRRGMLGGEADFDRNGRVSVQEAFRLAAEQAPGFTAGQKHGPQHPYIAGGDGKELFLDALPAPPPPPPPPKKLCILFICL